MPGFTFLSVPRIVAETGGLDRLGTMMAGLGARRVELGAQGVPVRGIGVLRRPPLSPGEDVLRERGDVVVRGMRGHQSRPTMSASRRAMRGPAAWPASTTSAWDSGVSEMPAPRLVTSEMPNTSSPA